MKDVIISKELTSVGIKDVYDNLFIPDWFVNQKPSSKFSAANTLPAPLDLVSIQKGEY